MTHGFMEDLRNGDIMIKKLIQHMLMITPRRLKKILEKIGFQVLNEAYFPFYRITKIKLPLMDIFSTKGNFVCKKAIFN